MRVPSLLLSTNSHDFNFNYRCRADVRKESAFLSRAVQTFLHCQSGLYVDISASAASSLRMQS